MATPNLIDPKLSEALADHHERLPSLELVDPVAVDDAATRAVGAADRLLRFEVWLDGLEGRKANGQLSPAGERAALKGLERAERDARELSAALLDAMAPFCRAEFFDEAVPYLCDVVKQVGNDVDASAVIRAAQEPVADLLRERGMSEASLELAARTPKEAKRAFDRLKLSCASPGVLEMSRGAKRAQMQPRTRVALPLLDGDTWVTGGLLKRLGLDEEAIVDKVPRSSPWADALALAKALTDTYEQRVREAREDGIRVWDTGFPWLILLVVVIVVALIVAGAIITILCATGNITNKDVCTLGIILIFAGLFIGCVALGGAVTGGAGGIACTLIFEG
ncbi:MAG TPA: hypothetical protein VGF25_22825 [Thermoleophilaceae bacterium]|jgi:hypothetical protein